MDLSFFHKTYIFSLDKRGEQGRELAKLAKSYGANVEVLVVGDGEIRKPKSYWRIDTEKPANWTGNRQTWNYTQCWFQLLEQVQSLHLRNFLLLEDDAQFVEGFAEKLDKSLTTFTKEVRHWDMLYLGSNQIKEDSLFGYKGLKTRKVADGILRSARARDMHAVACNSTMYFPLSALAKMDWLPQNPSFDETVAHGMHHQYQVFAFQPSLVKQKPGFSYNRGALDDRTHTW